ncbi:MAG: DUF2279 domain-containing protein [Cytophagales bacterium]|nr:YfiM family protein [Bernardetiaceae bacterium]MDW8203967.1 DUF2279 domain-containing protein [Cytophagales bacterium]
MMNKPLSRRLFLGCSAVVLAALIYYLLNKLWYAAVPRTIPRWFDDSRDWQQMDKAGHAYATYHMSRITYLALLWAGVPPEKARHYAALLGFGAISPIELLDSFAATHGASAYDLIANGVGATLFATQEQWWGKQIMQPKFWFSPSPYAALRPDKLGSNFAEQLIKDYNGQSYWLSFPVPLLPANYEWLRIAVGMGATGMVYGNPQQNKQAGWKAQRHFWGGIDLHLPERFRKNKWARLIGLVADLIRLPLPKISLVR